MAVYSHSRISCFEQCPLKFKFAYIEKLEPEIKDTIESFLGCRVHEALEKLYTDMKFEKFLSEDELIDHFNKIWDDEWHDEIGFVREYPAENYKRMGEEYLRQYYRKHYPFNQSKTIGLETNLQVPIDPEEEINFYIKIDRLAIDADGVYEVHDY
ncbi:MAG: RecB family exonuclease, partial [Nanoarchaeota archaeon]